MKILGIETSCDDTAVAVVENGRHILSSVVSSQIDIFAEYGGVIPEVAARSHLEAILPVLHQALSEANCTWDDIDAIAVTHTPGLMGSLLIGTLTARTLALLHAKPLYTVHHLKSHIYANWLKEGDEGFSENIPDSDVSRRISLTARSAQWNDVENGRVLLRKTFTPSFPLLALVISGGHTQILYMQKHNDFQIIGTTHDDAIGECFDKVAKILGLPYPGGPSIAKAAQNGNRIYHFPHPKVENLDFSFSGLKTAVLRTCQELAGGDFRTPSHEIKNLLTDQQKQDIACSFQQDATDILIEKLEKAKELYPDTKSLVIAGGVSANQILREKLKDKAYFPDPKLSGDNGAMVAAAAFYEIESGVQPADPYHVTLRPRTPIS